MVSPVEVCEFIPEQLKKMLSAIQKETDKLEDKFVTPWLSKVFEPINKIKTGLIERVESLNQVIDTGIQDTGKVINSLYADIKAFLNILLHVNSGSVFYLFVVVVLPQIQSLWPLPISISTAVQIAMILIMILFMGQVYMFISSLV